MNKQKEKMIGKMQKQIKGITLIALVVTIIVLLILSAVAINLSIGNNGIFKRAKDAVDIYSNSAKQEEEMMNDIFKTEWVYTFAGSSDIISINSLNEIYFWSGDTINLNKTAEIVGADIIYIQEENKYYSIEGNNNLEELPYKKVICNKNNYNAQYELLIMDNNNKIILLDSEGNNKYLDEIFPEFKSINFVDILDNGIMNADNGKQYMIEYYNDVQKKILCIQDELSFLDSKKVKDIGIVVPVILTEDGKVIEYNPADKSNIEIPFEEPITNMWSVLFKGESGNYYTIVPNEDNSVEPALISDVFPELKNEKVIKADGPILTESGKCYTNSEENLVNIVEKYNELNGEKIIDVTTYANSQRVNLDISVLTESGKVYNYNREEDKFELIIEDVSANSIKGKFNGITINVDGYSGIFKLQNQKLEFQYGIDNKEMKFSGKLPEKIKQISKDT